ncbi:MAG TPA: hypothetical protein VIR33_15290 [Thermopolyspora sp.]
MISNMHVFTAGRIASARLNVAASTAGSRAFEWTAARAIAKAAAYNAMRPVNDQKLIPNAGVRGPSTWRRPVRT